MKRMDKEMSYYGTSLKDLTSSGLEIHFGEFGVGEIHLLMVPQLIIFRNTISLSTRLFGIRT